MVEKLMRKHWPRRRCQDDEASLEATVKDTSGAFIALLVGLSTSLLTFIAEIIYDAVKKRTF